MTDIDPSSRPIYRWAVYNGKITRGQGTSEITVEGISAVTATLELSGLPTACGLVTASATFLRAHHVPPVREFDQFGPRSFRKVKSHLDGFARQLGNEPSARACIVSNGVWAMAKRAINYLNVTRQVEAGRVQYSEMRKGQPFLIKLYIVPAGSTSPCEVP